VHVHKCHEAAVARVDVPRDVVDLECARAPCGDLDEPDVVYVSVVV